MAQMKEQIKTPEKDLNKVEGSNLSDAKFQTLVIRMFKELSEDLGTVKKNTQSETKDTIVEIENNLQGNNSRVDEAEIQIDDVEHKEAKNNHTEQPEEKRIQNKGGIQNKQTACGTTSRGPTFTS